MFAVSESRCCCGAQHLIHGARHVCYICSPSRQAPTPWSPVRCLKRTCPGWPRQYYLLTWKTSIWYWPPAWTLRLLSQHTLCKSLLAGPESAEGSGLMRSPAGSAASSVTVWLKCPQCWTRLTGRCGHTDLGAESPVTLSLSAGTHTHTLTHAHIQITSLKTVSYIHIAETWIWTNIKPPFTHIFVVLLKQCPQPVIPDELFHTSIGFIAHVHVQEPIIRI